MHATKNLETCHQIPRAALDALLSLVLRRYKHIPLLYVYHLLALDSYTKVTQMLQSDTTCISTSQ